MAAPVEMFHLDDNRRASQAQGPCSNDYVRSWLEKTQRRPAWEPMTEGPQDTDVPWRPHDLEVVDTDKVPQRSFSRKRRRESLDSSIIPDRPRRGDHRSIRPRTSIGHSPPRQCHGRDARTRPRSSAAMSPIPSRHEPGRFERRARHKTRPDRYEAKRRAPAQVAEPGQRAKRTKTQDKKKLVSSREVMDSFTSDAILTQGRLTVGHNLLSCNIAECSDIWQVKPALTRGLYGNARCGSPNESKPSRPRLPRHQLTKMLQCPTWLTIAWGFSPIVSDETIFLSNRTGRFAETARRGG